MILRIVKEAYHDDFDNKDIFIYSAQVKKSFLGINYWREIGYKYDRESAFKLLNKYKEDPTKQSPKVVYTEYYKE